MAKPLTFDERKELVNKIYSLEEKEYNEYSDEEADFIMKCIYINDDWIKQAAENVISQSIMRYIQKRSTQLIQAKGVMRNLSSQDVEDIQIAGYQAFAGQFRRYIPNRGTKLTTFLTYWLDEAMNDQIDDIINHTDMTESEHRVNEFIGIARPILQSRGIEEPTAQDYYQLALEKGRDTNKYLNLTGIERALNSIKGYKGKSVEELDENGFLVHDSYDVTEDIIEKENYNNLCATIDKLAYFDKIAILSKVEAFEQSENDPKKKHDTRTIYFNAYKAFKKKTGITDLSQRDFTRLLTDATNELSARLAVKHTRRKHSTYVNNSLNLDDSFDSLFGEEATVSNDDINITLNIEFNSKYPV